MIPYSLHNTPLPPPLKRRFWVRPTIKPQTFHQVPARCPSRLAAAARPAAVSAGARRVLVGVPREARKGASLEGGRPVVVAAAARRRAPPLTASSVLRSFSAKTCLQLSVV